MLQHLMQTHKYIFLARLDFSTSWQYIGESNAESPSDAVWSIARSEMHNHGDAVTVSDVVDNYKAFSAWRVIQVAENEEALEEYDRGEVLNSIEDD